MAGLALGVPFVPQAVANVFIQLFGIPGALNCRLEDIAIECLAHALDDLLLKLIVGAEMLPPLL